MNENVKHKSKMKNFSIGNQKIIKNPPTTIIAMAAIVLLLLAGCTTSNNYSGADSGKYVVALTDAAADMGAVSKVNITIDEVKVYNETKGWVTISTTPKTYDLLELNADNTTVLLADANVPAGNYTQIELEVQKVIITDDNGTVEAKLPSNRFKVIVNTSLDANSTTVARFDVLARESLHVTGNGQYIFAPVVNLTTTEDANVKIKSNAEVEIWGGTNQTNIKVGMDEKGNVGVNVKIPASADITIDGLGGIAITTGVGVGVNNDNTGSSDGGSGIGIGVGVETSTGVEVNASIENYAFAPTELRVNQGDTVVWANFDSAPHTVTSTDATGELDSQTLPIGAKYAHTFNTKGTYTYNCTLHPAMTGTVIVE